MAQPRAGGQFRYNGDNPIGADAHALQPGQVVTVREIVAADEIGAHDNSEDAAVVIWDAPSLGQTEDGWGVVQVERAMSIGVSQFSDVFVQHRE